MVHLAGLEPTTHALKVHYSTDWVKGAYMYRGLIPRFIQSSETTSQYPHFCIWVFVCFVGQEVGVVRDKGLEPLKLCFWDRYVCQFHHSRKSYTIKHSRTSYTLDYPAPIHLCLSWYALPRLWDILASSSVKGGTWAFNHGTFQACVGCINRIRFSLTNPA